MNAGCHSGRAVGKLWQWSKEDAAEGVGRGGLIQRWNVSKPMPHKKELMGIRKQCGHAYSLCLTCLPVSILGFHWPLSWALSGK